MSDLDNPGPRGHENVIQLRPETDKAAPSGERMELHDVNIFGDLVVGWFAQRQHDLHHLLQVPAGTEVEMLDEIDPSCNVSSIILEGDALKAFRLGVQAAISILGDLPFGRVPAEPGGDANGKPS